MTEVAAAFKGPYRGLEPFDEGAMAFFFGRERDTRLITASLFAAPLTLLYGASGVGKSSVLRAGVLPQLRARKSVLPVVYPRFSAALGQQLSVERGWQTDPISGIKETAAIALFATAGEDAKQLQHYRDVVLKHEMSPLRDFLEAIAEASGRLVMVILDQFEEYSLYHPDEDAFAQQFPRAVASPDRSVAFLISLREDALAKLDRFKASVPVLWDSYRRIDHLDRASGEDAIRKPLLEYNRRLAPDQTPVGIEDDLVAQVLDQVQTGSVRIGETGSGALEVQTRGPARIETPYLQLVMTRLWEREHEEQSMLLRASTLRGEGNAEQIVLTHLDRVMSQFSEPERDLAVKIFDRLVTPGGAKIAFSVADLAKYEGVSLEVVRPVLQRLEEGNRRILRRVADPGDPNAEPRFEIFHDRLGRAMLAWRTKYLAERERAAASRQKAEEQRIQEQARRERERRVSAAMDVLDSGLQQTWAAMMFYLVDSSGARHQEPLSSLIADSHANPDDARRLFTHLLGMGIVREAFASQIKTDDLVYEIVDDPTAAALLDWHSRFTAARRMGADSRAAPSAPQSPPREPSAGAADAFPYQVVRELLERGDVVPFLGSGITISSASTKNGDGSIALTNRGLKESIARQCGYPATEFESSDIAEIASYFVQQIGRAELDALLQRAIGDVAIKPSMTHAFLAEVAQRHPILMLTTNYDRLMERALRALRVPFDVLAYTPGDRDGRDQLLFVADGDGEPRTVSASKFTPSPDRSLVFRVSGIGNGAPNGYVITEEDHIDWILRLRARDSWLPASIATLLDRRHLLSLGHGARDWSQRALWRTLTGGSGARKSAWAVSLHPSPLSVMTWQRYQVSIYNQDLNEWTQRMLPIAPTAPRGAA